jgi:hypothetical protein
VLAKILLGDLTGAKALVELGALTEGSPDDPLPRYLYARQLENIEAWTHGIRQLERALSTTGLPEGPLRDEAELTLGRLLLRAGRAHEAERHFVTAAGRDVSSAVRLVAEDWAERARFVARRAGPEPRPGPSE